MKLLGLLNAVADFPEFQQAVAAGVRGQSGQIRSAAGLWPALAAAISARHDLTVVVLPSTGSVQQFAQVLEAYTDAVEIFPAWETLPHERLSPRLDTMAQRNSVLQRLQSPASSHSPLPSPRILVTSARAWLQPILTQSLSVLPLRLRAGDSMDFSQVAQRLQDLGYERTEMVSARGQFAVRGGILDVFVPTDPAPLRLEFFGDEVEEVRSFSLTDQRSTEAAPQGLWAVACRELLATEELRAKARIAQTAFPAVSGILEQFSEGIYPPGIEALAPALGTETLPLVQLLPEKTQILALDPEGIVTRTNELAATTREFLEAAWDTAADGGKIPLSWEAANFLSLDQAKHEAIQRGFGWVTLQPTLSETLPVDDPAGRSELSGHTTSASEVDSTPDAAAADFTYFLAVEDFEITVPSREVEPYRGDIPRAIADLNTYLRGGWRLVVTTQGKGSALRIAELLNEGGLAARVCEKVPQSLSDPVVYICSGVVGTGVVLPTQNFALLSEQDFTGRRAKPGAPTKKSARRTRKTVDPLELKAGDYIVHEQHGVGRFVKMVSRNAARGGGKQVTRDYLVVEYAPAKRGLPPDLLYVSTDSLDQVSKYVGGDAPALNKMGGADWDKTKQKARKAVREIAAELVRLYAARTAQPGFAFSPDTPWQAELEDAFPYPETPDQLVTIAEVKADMEKPLPMDRLLCGDVGFGKTEVAVRAAFKAVQDGKQVAVLCPTTLLAAQHLETFAERFMGFPVRVEVLSRFTKPSEAAAIKADLLKGAVDVVIGTHALVTGQVRFKDLGLVIVDEEQRFGVEHKETLKQLRASVDVLAMSATPIPRTLEMAVTGIRELSMLQTPPEERLPVLTYVGRMQDRQVVAAIKRELMRDGQVFYVHNRTSDIDSVAAKLQELVPQARVAVAHGKMPEAALEQVIIDFWNREYDVLVCTTIVETGLDISNANTLIVDRADAMGLSQLHQLRGRVGRSKDRAYAYFFYPADKALTETALERLKTIASHTDLGAGIAVAMKDLEIRGAGNLLGGQQSGHIAGVGFDLYVRMVAEAVAEFKGEKTQAREEIKVELAVDANIPPAYIPGERLRLETYAKIANAKDATELTEVRAELRDRYGSIPAVVERLFAVAKLRQLMREKGIFEAATQGRYVRLAPVSLGAAQSARLNRLYPGSVQKAAVRQVLVPVPQTAKIGGHPLSDEPLLQWCETLITNVLAWSPTESD